MIEPPSEILMSEPQLSSKLNKKFILVFIASLFFGVTASYIDLLATFIWIPISMPSHELGHAIAYWLTGAPAIPSVFMTVILGARSFELSLIITVSLIGIIALLKLFNRSWLSLLALLFLLIQIPLSFICASNIQDQVCISAGFAGEALIAPFFIFLFFENMGNWWERHKLIFAAAATVSLGHSLGQWLQALLGSGTLPYGSALFGEEHGDLNQLVSNYQWTENGISSLYLAIGMMSLFASVICIVIRAQLKEPA